MMGNAINPNGTKGKQSPSWAFWNRFYIPCPNGEQYLARLRVFDTPWFGVYLHDIFEPDADRDPHNHPWPFISIVLRGSYEEQVHPEPNGRRSWFVKKHHRRFSAHRMGTVSAHRITYAAPRLKTLIIRGKRTGGWGFFTQGGYVPWQEYMNEAKWQANHPGGVQSS
jgi:hypothetical protein